jgi:hypothetical protein
MQTPLLCINGEKTHKICCRIVQDFIRLLLDYNVQHTFNLFMHFKK